MRERIGVFCVLLAGACGPQIGGGQSTARTEEGLSGCRGIASAAVPASGSYFLTTFGGSPADDGTMSCGSRTQLGSWYYAASRQRYGCGAHVQIEANGRCVVAQTDDYGPDECVERAAGGPVLDVSPLVAKDLFGARAAGWSEHRAVQVTEVARSTPLGPCTSADPTPPPGSPPSGSPPSGSPPSGGADCHSSTLAQNVPTGTCVQSAADASWYSCVDGAWYAGQSGCVTSYAYCHSATLGTDVPPRTCVQSVFDSTWYQCGASGWESPVSSGAGPLGVCSTMYAL